MNFLIPKELLQAIGDYLSTKPYAEVAGLISHIQALKPAPSEAPQNNADQA
jgi:hypothetical protein